MTKTKVLAVAAFALAAVSAHAQPTVGWPETVDRLNEQRSQAEACLELLKDSGDAAAIRKGRIAYGVAKSASDGVISAFTVGLVEGYAPEKLPPLQANLDRAGKGLKEVCDAAVSAAPASGTNGVVEELAKGAVEPVVDGLKAAAGALWERHVKMEQLEIETIKSQLEAAKWPEFGSQ
jgi:hypothetical protein